MLLEYNLNKYCFYRCVKSITRLLGNTQLYEEVHKGFTEEGPLFLHLQSGNNDAHLAELL